MTKTDSPGLTRDTTPVLEATHIKKSFGETGFLANLKGQKPVKAVNDVSISVRPAEIVGLVGESGCGKSTLGKTLAYLYPDFLGQIKFRGDDLKTSSESQFREYRKNCRIVFQDPESSLNPQKSVMVIIQRPLKLFTDLNRKERRARVFELLDQVNLHESTATKYPHELSGGEQQRVAIARAFATNPSFIVLDEPVASLDVSIQAKIINLLQTLSEENDTSYLFISHNIDAVRSICDRVYVMYLGKIVECGDASSIFNPPHHPYTKSLMANTLPVDPTQTRQLIMLEGDVPNARNPPPGCNFHTRCPFKIGDVCEKEVPALETTRNATDHQISCHLDESEMM